MTRKPSFSKIVKGMEENRTPVGRPDFKSGERRKTSLVGSTPTLFRQTDAVILLYSKPLGGKKATRLARAFARLRIPPFIKDSVQTEM